MTGAVQLDLFDLLEPASEPALDSRYDEIPVGARAREEAQHARRVADRQAQRRGEQPQIGLGRHAWTIGITHPDGWDDWPSEPHARWVPSPHCAMTVLSVDLRCGCWGEPCYCVGDLLHRGACLRCDWEGTPRIGENAATEDAADHAHPGWRDLPAVDPAPYCDGTPSKAYLRWLKTVEAAYPPEWVGHPGGPIRTRRNGAGSRHVPGRSPWGGYDLAADPSGTTHH